MNQDEFVDHKLCEGFVIQRIRLKFLVMLIILICLEPTVQNLNIFHDKIEKHYVESY